MVEQDVDTRATAYHQILTLLSRLSVDELARLALEINQRVQRDPDGRRAHLRAAVDSVSWEDDEHN